MLNTLPSNPNWRAACNRIWIAGQVRGICNYKNLPPVTRRHNAQMLQHLIKKTPLQCVKDEAQRILEKGFLK